jgi:hypothetical protein
MGFLVTSGEEFDGWFDRLNHATKRAVNTKVEMLQLLGPSLGGKAASALIGSRYSLRELKVKETIRIAYGFYPQVDDVEQIVLLLGGDKKGDNRFYDWFIPKADELWLAWLSLPDEDD